MSNAIGRDEFSRLILEWGNKHRWRTECGQRSALYRGDLPQPRPSKVGRKHTWDREAVLAWCRNYAPEKLAPWVGVDFEDTLGRLQAARAGLEYLLGDEGIPEEYEARGREALAAMDAVLAAMGAP